MRTPWPLATKAIPYWCWFVAAKTISSSPWKKERKKKNRKRLRRHLGMTLIQKRSLDPEAVSQLPFIVIPYKRMRLCCNRRKCHSISSAGGGGCLLAFSRHLSLVTIHWLFINTSTPLITRRGGHKASSAIIIPSCFQKIIYKFLKATWYYAR